MIAHRTAFPIAAALLTGVIAFAGGWVGARPGAGLLLLGLIPLAVPSLWGASLLVTGATVLHLMTAGACLAALAGMMPITAVAACAAYVASGLGVAWGLGRGWRNDAVLGLALLPVILLSLATVGDQAHADLLEEAARQHVTQMRQQLSEGEHADERAVLLDEYEHAVAGTVRIMLRIWPGLLFLSLLAQAGLVMLIVRWLGRGPGKREDLRPLPVFHQWRVPFYWVWVLVGGLMFFAMRTATLVATGENVIFVAAVILGVQGLAVQVFLIGRLVPPWARILFWVGAAVLMFPLLLILAGSVLLGLADQWLDFRRRIAAVADGI
jgi:hypothetical protein